ncbi:hypothetical protein BJV78DRAFT_1282078 [Lactifluus subvellereus]|nr:hypothetical protein BJV78DRAFT_1282078 [Lactifluus subvellereus]
MRVILFSLLPVLLSRGLLAAAAATPASDPCAKVAGLPLVNPQDAIACQKSFPFNETLRQNVLSVVSRVFDFYTFEDFYLKSPPPFQDSTTDIRAQIKRINSTQYATDYDFNMDLWDFTLQLNDGHTRWIPNCYQTYQHILPAPVVILGNDIFIAPNSVEFLSQLGPKFLRFFEEKGFDWKRLAGARVLTIGNLPAWEYIDKIAHTVSGNFLDHNVRVNSAVSSYRIVNSNFSQNIGDIAGRSFLTHTSLEFTLIPVNSTTPECVHVPFVAAYIGAPFTDQSSYWANNCAANNRTNGLDRRSGVSPGSGSGPGLARAALLDPFTHPRIVAGLSDALMPTLSPTNGSTGSVKSFILPGSKTGVMFVGSFLGNYTQFPIDVEAAVNEFKASGVTNLVIDVTSNGGGFICLAMFLHQYLGGLEAGASGFNTTSRANLLAQKIVEAEIAQGLNASFSKYSPDNWAFSNNTHMPLNHNYLNSTVPHFVNGRSDPTSQRFTDLCPAPVVRFPDTPPFDLSKVVIVGNALCASACAQFATVMFERHQTKIVTFGGDLSRPIEFKGMAGSQVLEWAELDSEIKTAGLKNDPLAPPDLLVNANMRHNWRTAYSFLDEKTPIQYRSERSQYRFPYTAETYMNPQKVWTFIEQKFFD